MLESAMFAIYELPKGKYIIGNIPEECRDTNLAKQWALYTSIGELATRFWIMDLDSYLMDYRSHGKRSSIGLYMVIVHEAEDLATLAGITDLEGFNQIATRYPGQVEKIGIEVNKHCLDMHDPEMNILEIEVSELIKEFTLAEEE